MALQNDTYSHKIFDALEYANIRPNSYTFYV